METFTAGRWGEALDGFSEDAFLTAFFDDGLEAALDFEESPLCVVGHAGLARYTATVNAWMIFESYDLVAMKPPHGRVATDAAWVATMRKTDAR